MYDNNYVVFQEQVLRDLHKVFVRGKLQKDTSYSSFRVRCRCSNGGSFTFLQGTKAEFRVAGLFCSSLNLGNCTQNTLGKLIIHFEEMHISSSRTSGRATESACCGQHKELKLNYNVG